VRSGVIGNLGIKAGFDHKEFGPSPIVLHPGLRSRVIANTHLRQFALYKQRSPTRVFFTSAITNSLSLNTRHNNLNFIRNCLVLNCHLKHSEDGGNRHFRNAGTYIPVYTASSPRRRLTLVHWFFSHKHRTRLHHSLDRDSRSSKLSP
jgi:hypothetical protein